MKTINMNEAKFSPNIFSGGMHLKGSTKMGTDLRTTSERLCSICINYNKKNNILMDFNIDKIHNTGFKKLNCRLIGKIKNPDDVYCSWWKIKLEEKIKTKKCSVCEELKPISEFYKDKSSEDGHQYKCSKCSIEYARNWQNENKRK